MSEHDNMTEVIKALPGYSPDLKIKVRHVVEMIDQAREEGRKQGLDEAAAYVDVANEHGRWVLARDIIALKDKEPGK